MRLESLAEGASLALEQLRANKFRSGLTILGIVVGVATVMAVSAMIEGIRSSVVDEMEAFGPKNFVVARFNTNSVMIATDGPPWGDNPPVRPHEIRRIEQLPGVRRAIIDIRTSREMSNGSQIVSSVPIIGGEPGFLDFSNATIISGHDLLPGDVQSGAPVVMITTYLAESLFGALDPIGRRVRVDGRPLEVIAVVKMSENVFSSFQRNIAFMPWTTAVRQIGAWDGMLQAAIEPTASTSQADAMDQVTTFLRSSRGLRPSDPNNFALIRQEEFLNTFNQITGVFFMVMMALSSVGLMVGGVGVVAIMMIAVTERTREIGIRKAIGATRGEILWQFLFEAVTVTCIGAIIGMLIGAGIAFAVAAFTPVPASVPIGAILAALAMSAIAGIAFGMWPAWRAAKMDPVVALRHE